MNLKPYPKYKPSGIEWLGEIPEDWEMTRLRFITKVNPTKGELNGLNKDDLVSFLPMEEISSDGTHSAKLEKRLGEVESSYTYFRENDVLFAKITPCFENNKGAIAKNLTNGIGFGTTELHVLRSLSKCFNEFLYYITISDPFRKWGYSYMYGAGGQKRVPEEFIKDYYLPFPTIGIQRKISAFLDSETSLIDTLIAKKQRQIELLKEKRIALITNAVTKGLDPNVKMKPSGIEWLGEIPEEWKASVVKRGYSVQLGKMLQNNKTNDSDVLVNYLRAVHIQNEGINTNDLPEMWASKEELTQYGVRIGDLLICEGGEAGRSAFLYELENDCIIQNALHRVRSKTNELRYLHYFLQIVKNSGWMEVLCNKATIMHFTREKLVDLEIVLPNRKVQKDITDYLDKETTKIDKMMGKINHSISLLQEFRSSLITDVVAGKIQC